MIWAGTTAGSWTCWQLGQNYSRDLPPLALALALRETISCRMLRPIYSDEHQHPKGGYGMPRYHTPASVRAAELINR